MHTAGIGARDDTEIRVGPAGQGRFQLFYHFRQRDNLFSVQVAAPLGRDLVFDVNGGDADALVFTHGAHEIDGIAISRIGVGDDGNLHRRYNLGGALDHFRHGDQADIR